MPKRRPKKPVKRRARKPSVVGHRKGDWRKTFLATLSDGWSITQAAKRARVARQTAYERRDTDAKFAEAWDEAIEQGTDELEDQAKKFSKRNPIMVMFLLKKRRPDVYGDRIRVTGEMAILWDLPLPAGGALAQPPSSASSSTSSRNRSRPGKRS